MRHLTSLALIATLLSGCVVGADDPGWGDPASDRGGGGGDGSGNGTGTGTKLLPAGKIAVVLAHGLGGSADSFDPAIVAAIQADGHVVVRTQVPAIDSVALRAAALGPQLDALIASTGAAKVHVIAHSMGGLDARYAISRLGYANRVASLTTISTPHHGSPLADLALGLTSSTTVSQQDALAAIADLLGVGLDPAALNRALTDLAETNAPAFNAANPDAAGVRYFSYAGFSTPNAISNPNAAAACAGAPTPEPDQMRGVLLLSAPIVSRGLERHPNDGVVSVASSTWTGFQGCISADHLDETVVPEPGTPGLDTPTFYKAIVAKLATL